MLDSRDVPVDYVRRLTFMREETRFEIGLLNDRVNALISAEAFLTIAFTMAMSNSNPHWGAAFSTLVPPILSLLGFILAILAWPGVAASYKIIVEWNVYQIALMHENPAMTDALWRVDALGRGSRPEVPERGLSMLFARAAPAVFSLAWAILTAVALILPLRRFDAINH
jgi:hypothetical protein